ncbi:MAG: molybdate ABC transporter substrate-binding protein [Thermoanaerobaculia bacterium]|jgi:molybdate transport system substrate-binding protein|nr:molybdate ABC transporter substrate-binding protein [Thermoanaerobaculia bacterium]MBP9825044.1 molybdate ABC transporter substrate-binding protein [Thermoanaerobaculia bacterium]
MHLARSICLLFSFLAVASPAQASVTAGPGAPVELRFYAAASLRDVLRELTPALERATGTTLVWNLGASSDLARQIVAAGKADLFFSADEGWMDHLAAEGLVDAASRRSPLSNRLVVIVPADSPLRLTSARDLASPAVRRLSLAHPEAVPAGKYARAWLEQSGVWSAVAKRVVPALDVRAALAAVESGAIEAGIVYRTDVVHAPRVRVALEVPEGEGPSISYALAALADRPHLERARAVVAWLCGPEAVEVFARHGFGRRESAR